MQEVSEQGMRSLHFEAPHCFDTTMRYADRITTNSPLLQLQLHSNPSLFDMVEELRLTNDKLCARHGRDICILPPQTLTLSGAIWHWFLSEARHKTISIIWFVQVKSVFVSCILDEKCRMTYAYSLKA